MRRSGLALILVVGVLGVLAVLGSAFAVLSRLERRAAVQRVLGTQAMLLARSGVEDALARIGMGMDLTERGSAYRGEDWNDDGAVTGLETASEVYQPGTANRMDCPVRHAMAPSFFKRHATDLDANGRSAPERMRVDGRERGYSGRLSQGTWSLKVEDESAKINVNGGFLDALDRDDEQGGMMRGRPRESSGIPDHRDPDVRMDPSDPKDTGRGWNFQLVRILNNLGAPVAQGGLGIPDLGTLAIQKRPLGGWRSIADLQAAVGTATDLSPYLTVSSWIDRGVVHPNGYDGQAGADGPGFVKRARAPLALEEGGRAPVNLNAATPQVLKALLMGLKGYTWQEPDYPLAYDYFPFPNWRQGFQMANAIAAARPFRTWGEFSAFLDSQAGVTLVGMNQGIEYGFRGGGNLCVVDLLKANFNPNTDSAKELPDPLLWKWIDKTDLVVWSTEGCLEPTGIFRISSTGRVTGPEGRLRAEAGAAVTAEGFSILRQTSQRDFVAGRDLSDAPGSPRYLSLSTDPLLRTAGASASWRCWAGAERQGLSAVTYPCPPMALPGKASATDGFVALATIEREPSDPQEGSLRFLHHFDDGWDADLGRPAAIEPAGPNRWALQTDVSEGVWPAEGEPGTLYPDGMHSQKARVPSFRGPGNLPDSVNGSDHGVLGLWAKCVVHRDNNGQIAFSMARTNAAGDTQALFVGRNGWRWGMIVENFASPLRGADADMYHEQRAYTDDDSNGSRWIFPDHRWRLVTALWDTDEPAQGLCLRLGVRQVQMNGLPGAGGYPEWDTLTIQSFQDPSPDVLRMAAGGQNVPVLAAPPWDFEKGSLVLDELALYDFGPDAAAAWEGAEKEARRRWQDGRYYKGDDAAFLSAPLSPRPGSRVSLVRASWTQYLPGEDRPELRWDAVMPASGQPRFPDPFLQRADMALELRDGAGEPLAMSGRLSQGGRIGLSLESFRYRANFRPNLSQPLDQPVLETPVLDDITFAYVPVGGPRFLAWER